MHPLDPHTPENHASSPGIARRRVLQSVGAATAGTLLMTSSSIAAEGAAAKTQLPGYDAAKGEYVLPPLDYDYKALEPSIDTQTMQLHHDKHHLAYVTGLNTALTKLADARKSGDFALVKHWSREAAFHG